MIQHTNVIFITCLDWFPYITLDVAKLIFPIGLEGLTF